MVAGEHAITITATANARWRVVATYASVTTTEWGVNARGQSYGVQNDHGTPDLIAAWATNGKRGYVSAVELAAATNRWVPTNPAEAAAGNPSPRPVTIPVYESDGTTVIGEFVVN